MNQEQPRRSDDAIHYNEWVERYARSGKIEPAAQKAMQALNDEQQARELRKAEEQGKSRSAERR